MRFSIYFMFVFLLSSQIAISQQFGGEIKLKISYEDKPLVGYTITGSINKIDIGGKGITDMNGNVTLHTNPLPVPNIDVKGVLNCENTTREWEASGFVYVSPTTENYYHLQLEKVVKQMNEFTNIPINVILESFGLNCSGALGGDNIASDETEENQDDIKTETDVSSKDDDNSMVADDNTDKKNNQFTEDWISGKTTEEGFQNKRTMLLNQIDKINAGLNKKNETLENDNLSKKDKNKVLYDIKELNIEKQIKEVKLEKVNLQIKRGYVALKTSERKSFKERENVLEEELKSVKENRKKNVSLIENDTDNTDNEILTWSDSEIKNMSILDLKRNKIKVKSNIQKKKISLKTKASLLKQDEKKALQDEIIRLNKVFDLIQLEIDERK